MVQEILVYLIIAGAIAYTAYNVYQIFNPKKINSGKCAGCSTGSCEIKSFANKKI
ncbi:FeoB-associated Cys-rich membrane protein [Tenuifilum thalassicum]|uniref:FeoB-associated Cys-rich membrane protein n=1 Tax=Tenuifilum thalassicum TaxID=2590900 RepID=A0A7D3XVQ7_9BACT|nr:FeoB-associated Cys-rich membrane protein [Tenuifilum thalassicum]QKG80111.1 FeoB-associated Cys-rich membrane protein [Tenuifilum thalassicum]